MGNRWKNHTRKICVEDCERREANQCQRCGRAIRYTYFARPSSLAAPVWACRLCLGLTYFATQSRKTRAGDLVRVPGALREVERQYFESMESAPTLCEPPPLEVRQKGRRAVARWFRERDAQRARGALLLDLMNRVPPRLQMQAMMGCLPQREPLHKKKKRVLD